MDMKSLMTTKLFNLWSMVPQTWSYNTSLVKLISNISFRVGVVFVAFSQREATVDYFDLQLSNVCKI